MRSYWNSPMQIDRLKDKINQLRGQCLAAGNALRYAQSASAAALCNIADTEDARILIQITAKETQDQLRYRICELGTMALSAVFPDPIELDLQFRENRGRTEGHLYFVRNNHPLDPLSEDSGGACNIAGLALQISMLAAHKPALRRIMVLDEPGHDVNDETREMHHRLAEVLRLASDELNMQFLIVTMIKELAEVGEAIDL